MTSPSGLTASKVWSGKDKVLSATNAQGIMSTTIYNAQDRATDSYGPAPVACFDSARLPLGTCPILPAHTSTAYDAGLKGLHAAWYANASVSGAPRSFELVIWYGRRVGVEGLDHGLPGHLPDGRVVRAADRSDHVPGGRHLHDQHLRRRLVAARMDRRRLQIADNETPGAQGNGSPHRCSVTVAAGQQARIRVQYADITGTAKLELHWNTARGCSGCGGGGDHPRQRADAGLWTGERFDDRGFCTHRALPG